MWIKLREILLASLIAFLYRFWAWTWRIAYINRPDPKNGPYVYAHWHGDELLMIGGYIQSGMAVMASWSKDGSLMRRVLTLLGYRVVRGSSTRGGGAGLKGLIDSVTKEGRDTSLAVDGPRGPIYQVKPGVIKLAQQTGRPLIAAASAARQKYVFKKAWNQCYLPWPTTRCVILFGSSKMVPIEATEEELEQLRLSLQLEMVELQQEVVRRLEQSATRGGHRHKKSLPA